MSGNRAERIARVIRDEASRVILYELADPRIGFVTVTKVKVSGDLQNARVYVSVYGNEADKTKTMMALARAASVVRRAVSPRLKTRRLPVITFEFDDSVEGAFRVEGLISEARATDADAASEGAREPDGDVPRPDESDEEHLPAREGDSREGEGAGEGGAQSGDDGGGKGGDDGGG